MREVQNWRKRLLVLIAIGAVLIAGTAIAAWTLTTTGAGSTVVATIQLATIQPDATQPATLLPGATAPLFFTVANPNTIPLTLTSVTGGTMQVDGADSAGCPNTNFSITPGSNTGLSITLLASTSSSPQHVSVPNMVTLASNSPTQCQGATFTYGSASFAYQAGS